MSRCDIVIGALLISVLLVLSGPANAACIVGELANFDIHNYLLDDVYGFTLVLEGDYTGEIESFYESTLYGTPTVALEGGNTVITWTFVNPITWCTWIHLGVQLVPGASAPVVVDATLNDAAGSGLATMPFPWQRWVGTIECPVIDIIDPNPTIPPVGVWVQRQAALSWSEIPLQNLTLDDPMVVGLPWTSYGGAALWPEPDSMLILVLQTAGEAAAVVRYDVSDPVSGDQYVRFLSEAILASGPSVREQSTWGRIKSMYR